VANASVVSMNFTGALPILTIPLPAGNTYDSGAILLLGLFGYLCRIWACRCLLSWVRETGLGRYSGMPPSLTATLATLAGFVMPPFLNWYGLLLYDADLIPFGWSV
jgi:hypothetical protein